MRSQLLFQACALASVAYAAFQSPVAKRQSNCTSIDTRIEWRNLDSAQQTAYIDAELCMLALPAATALNDVVTRADDLTAAHQYLTPVIHVYPTPNTHSSRQNHTLIRLLRMSPNSTHGTATSSTSTKSSSATNATTRAP